MKNIIVFEPEDFKDTQKRDILEILSQAPFSLISRDSKIPQGYRVFPKLKIRSNKHYPFKWRSNSRFLPHPIIRI